MDIKEINYFIESEIKRLESYYSKKDKEELTMAMGFKVVEEIGELFNEILAHKGYQRKDKLDKLNKEEINKEFADVIFTILILAKRFNIDVEQAIRIKMEEIKKRSYK
jgi:NTP pyrophosphatase (non-canonical NTP hydrolase)